MRKKTLYQHIPRGVQRASRPDHFNSGLLILHLHLVMTNIYYIMTVYDTKPGSHTTIILLDTANKQTNKLMDKDAVQRFSVSRRTTNEKNSKNCRN